MLAREVATTESEEIKREQSGGEQEVPHELRLDGKARRVRKAESPKGATGTKEGGLARETGEVE